MVRDGHYGLEESSVQITNSELLMVDLICWLCVGVTAVLSGKLTLRKWAPSVNSEPYALGFAVLVTVGASLEVANLGWLMATLSLPYSVLTGFLPFVVYWTVVVVVILAVFYKVFLPRMNEMRSAMKNLQSSTEKAYKW